MFGTISTLVNYGLVAAFVIIFITPDNAQAAGEPIAIATIVCDTHDQVRDIAEAHRDNGHEAALSVYYAYNHIHSPRSGQACEPYKGEGIVLEQHETFTDLVFSNGHYYQITIIHVRLMPGTTNAYVMQVTRMQAESI